MMLIGKTANWLLRHSVQCCVKCRRWVSAHARNHVICLTYPKRFIALVLDDVNLPYCTSEVEHIVAFTAIFSNSCTAHAQKPSLMNFSKSRRNGPPKWRFLGKMGVQTIDNFRDPQKALPCAELRRLMYFCVKIGARVSAVAFPKNQKIAESLCAEGPEITHAQNQNP